MNCPTIAIPLFNTYNERMKIFFCLYLLWFSLNCFAAESYLIPNDNDPVKVDEFSVCQMVANNHATETVYVPTSTAAEWTSFRTNPPSSITFSACSVIDANVSVLIKSDTTNGSTTFTDSSNYGIAITGNGGISHSTATAKFGSSSIYFDGSNDYFSFASSSYLALGNSFTIDMWIKPTIQSAISGALISHDTYTAALRGPHNGGTSIHIYLGNYGGSGGNFNIANDGNWHHLAWVRNASNDKIYLDGTLVLTKTTGTSWSSNSGLKIGFASTGQWGCCSNYFKGYMDEIRISKGVQRWTSNFTPPTSPY